MVWASLLLARNLYIQENDHSDATSIAKITHKATAK
jgi:hypothetical protein